jgi:hypothetical protein
MSTDRLDHAFASGVLLHPVSTTPSFLDLTRALANKLDVAWPGSSSKQSAVSDFIGDSEHLVFVLVDAMGCTLLDLLPPTAFLRSQRTMELRAIFPSTTACALTTLATGLWPGQHGVPGWWAFLAEKGISVTTLPFEERYSETLLDTLGVTPNEIWPFPAWMQGVKRHSLCVLPAEIVNSPLTRYSRGGKPGFGYKSITEAVEAVASRISQVATPSYTYLYLPEFDSVCHSHGVNNPKTTKTLALIDAELERLATLVGRRARLVISADHGHINVNRAAIWDDDPLLKLLLAPPTGEPRVPVFHVREGCEAAFEDLFSQRFSEQWVLLPTAQAAKMKLLGPEQLSPLAISRFGNYLGIATKPVTLQYKSSQQTSKPDNIGSHAGLSPAEMRIPLIVA